jgi:alkaline phosphatase D
LTAEFVRVSSIREPDPTKVTASVSRRFAVLDGRPGLQDA